MDTLEYFQSFVDQLFEKINQTDDPGERIATLSKLIDFNQELASHLQDRFTSVCVGLANNKMPHKQIAALANRETNTISQRVLRGRQRLFDNVYNEYLTADPLLRGSALTRIKTRKQPVRKFIAPVDDRFVKG